MDADSYQGMVQRLFKKTDIFASDAMHAAIGISGEVAELMEARTPVNRREELGDVLFYIEAYCQLLKIDRFDIIDLPKDADLQPIAIHLFCIVVSAGALLDTTKKSWIYGRAPDLNVIGQQLCAVYWEVACLALHFGLGLSELETSNREKLQKRYPEKFYTDAHAIARLDKAAEEVQDVVVISDAGRRRSEEAQGRAALGEGSVSFLQAIEGAGKEAVLPFEPNQTALRPLTPEEIASLTGVPTGERIKAFQQEPPVSPEEDADINKEK